MGTSADGGPACAAFDLLAWGLPRDVLDLDGVAALGAGEAAASSPAGPVPVAARVCASATLGSGSSWFGVRVGILTCFPLTDGPAAHLRLVRRVE